MFQKFEVGKPFPLTEYNKNQEGLILSFQPDTINFVCLVNKPTKKEIKNFQTGNFRYGLFIRNAVPFFAFEWQDFSMDASANLYKVKADYHQHIIQSDGNAVTLWLVDTVSYRLKAQRLIGFNTEAMALFRTTLQAQLDRYDNTTEVDRAIGGIIRSFSTADMLKEADKRYSIKRK